MTFSLPDVIFPKSKGEAACPPVLVGEIKTIVVVAMVYRPVPVIEAFIVRKVVVSALSDPVGCCPAWKTTAMPIELIMNRLNLR